MDFLERKFQEVYAPPFFLDHTVQIKNHDRNAYEITQKRMGGHNGVPGHKRASSCRENSSMFTTNHQFQETRNITHIS